MVSKLLVLSRCGTCRDCSTLITDDASDVFEPFDACITNTTPTTCKTQTT